MVHIKTNQDGSITRVNDCPLNRRTSACKQIKTEKKLNLYVWENIPVDWASGIMFALAESVEEARKLILDRAEYVDMEDLAREPRCINKPEGFAVRGG